MWPVLFGDVNTYILDNLANGLCRERQFQWGVVMPDETPDPKEQLKALIDAADYYNADLASIVGRDKDDKLEVVGVVARGWYAPRLERYLKRLSKEAADDPRSESPSARLVKTKKKKRGKP